MSDKASPPDSGAPPVNFSQFIVSLGSSALVHLGEIDDPSSGARRVDLKMARHTIDVLGLLELKTRGNLEADEQKLLETLLFELRTKYMHAGRDPS
jgi:hypothetical protein